MSAIDTLISPLGRLLRNRRAGLEYSVRTAPELQAPETIQLTSESFEHGAPIPDAHASMGRGPNRSPQLGWSNVPDSTRQLVLIMEDIDIPGAKPSIHMLGLLGPGITSFAEGALVASNPSVRWVPRRGLAGYFGPRALPGHGIHRYGFHLYALDIEIPATTPIPNADALRPLVDGHVLATGFLEGTQIG